MWRYRGEAVDGMGSRVSADGPAGDGALGRVEWVEGRGSGAGTGWLLENDRVELVGRDRARWGEFQGGWSAGGQD